MPALAPRTARRRRMKERAPTGRGRPEPVQPLPHSDQVQPGVSFQGRPRKGKGLLITRNLRAVSAPHGLCKASERSARGLVRLRRRKCSRGQFWRNERAFSLCREGGFALIEARGSERSEGGHSGAPEPEPRTCRGGIFYGLGRIFRLRSTPLSLACLFEILTW